MTTVEQTFDKEYIKNVLLTPSILKEMSDDSVPQNIGDVMMLGLDIIGGHFLKVTQDGEDAGAFWLVPTPNGLEAHTALLPNCRGKSAVSAGRQCIEWCFKNTDAQEITSYAFSDSPAVHWFCRILGLKAFLTEPWRHTRNGQQVNITRYRIQRGA